MPSINRDAKAFETNRAHWFAFAVRTRRKALKLTAAELSRRTADLGYPISRGAIAKIESELRSGKVDMAEILVLARALDLPPVLLIFPGFTTDGPEEVLPGHFVRNEDALRWVSGAIAYPQECDTGTLRPAGEPEAVNSGVALIDTWGLLQGALDARISLVNYLQQVEREPGEAENARAMLQRNAEQIAGIRQRIRHAREDLWGLRDDSDDWEDEGDE